MNILSTQQKQKNELSRPSPSFFAKAGGAVQYIKKRPKRFVSLFLVLLVVMFHIWLHLANPYADVNFVETPFTTKTQDSKIVYEERFSPHVYSNSAADFLGYYRQGFLIVQNTLFGGQRAEGQTSDEIIDSIHKKRFDPAKPYLISGDQFSVLYPRNLGVFYNQLLDPDTAHSKTDWENRQRIYLQSSLYAIEGLSDSTIPKTTLIPIGPKSMVTTEVHPGDVASDATYGLLYALDTMNTPRSDQSGIYTIQTQDAIQRILKEKKDKLRHIVAVYLKTVQDPRTGLIRKDIHLSSARDGVSRKSSFYDNIILWKTLELANKLEIIKTPNVELSALQHNIKQTYWNDKEGFYNNDQFDHSFSSDWLIGYVTGFFNLNNQTDLDRTKRTITYVKEKRIAEPLPIKYQVGSKAKSAPFIIKAFVPSYGSETIWSYWGSQYITLLGDVSKTTKDLEYKKAAETYVKRYEKAIVRDGGFAETYSPDGTFFRHGLYKSIRMTGWVVQFEHAKKELELAT